MYSRFFQILLNSKNVQNKQTYISSRHSCQETLKGLIQCLSQYQYQSDISITFLSLSDFVRQVRECRKSFATGPFLPLLSIMFASELCYFPKRFTCYKITLFQSHIFHVEEENYGCKKRLFCGITLQIQIRILKKNVFQMLLEIFAFY